MSIVADRIAELRKQAPLHLLGALALAVPLYLACFLACFFVDAFRAWWLALLAVLALLVIGLLSRWRQAHDEWRSYELPFESWNGGSWAVNRGISRVTGPAYVISEFVMGCGGQLLRCMGKLRQAGALRSLDHLRVEDLADDLRRRGTTPRFHPIAELGDVIDLLVPLIAADILWYKEEAGVSKVGLNRRYDGPTRPGSLTNPAPRLDPFA